MRKIDTIVIHHSGNTDSFDKIKELHIKTNRWDDIGYHFVIEKDGTVKEGRKLDVIGAHVKGFNKNSVGICLCGNFDITKPTQKQMKSLISLVKELKNKFNIKTVKGHNEFPNVAKSCPGKNLSIFQQEI